MAKLLFELYENNEQFRSTVTFDVIKVPANTIIIKENTAHYKIYMIKQGLLRVMQAVKMEDNRLIHPCIQDVGEGSYVGEFCLFERKNASADVVTVTECELIEVDQESCLKFMDENPDIGYAFTKQMIEELIEKVHRSNRSMQLLLVWGLKQYGIDKEL